MAGGGAVNRGPHTGSGTEASSLDLNGPQRKSLLSNFDFSEIAKLQIPPASGIADYAIFDRDDRTCRSRQVRGASRRGLLCPFEISR